MSLFRRFFKPRIDTSTVATRSSTPMLADPADVVAIEALLSQQDHAQAQHSLDECLERHPEDPALRLLSARLHRAGGRPAQALAECELALASHPQPSEVQLEMARASLALPDLEAALDHLNVAVCLDDSNGPGWATLGEVLSRLDRHAEAHEAFHQATLHIPADQACAQAYFLLGQECMQLLRIGEAKESFARCLELDPEHPHAHNGLGTAALWDDNETEAVDYFDAAIQRTPHPGRLLLLNHGAALQNSGRFEEAQRILQRVVIEHPADHTARWYMCQLDLLLCRWEQGWPNYPARFGSGATSYRPLPYRPWDGREAKSDTLLVVADEGLGDEIMYASCLAEAVARVGHVIVECEPRLQRIFERSFPQVQVIGSRREANAGWLKGLPVPDWQIAAGDLPGVFRRSDSAFPQHTGYLRADDARVAHWRQRLDELGPGLKVGLSWRGGTVRTRTRTRSIGAEEWGPILTTPGVQFINLQYGDYKEELAALRCRFGDHIHDFPEALADYDETAALVASLDLVVTVCTAIVHLSGALGQPVWVLTPLAPGWRYTAHRDRMPWYPSSRIFRQTHWGEWGQPCQELAVALQDMTKKVTVIPHVS